MPVSKTQIDRLGERLKNGSHTDDDLRLLDEYRSSFGEACEEIIRRIQRHGVSVNGRRGKTTRSIVEKLRRESIRLSQMQDIAGCRVVVTDVGEQDQFVESLKIDFPKASVVDRRKTPSHGYRAVHVIAEVAGKPIEIQVRSALQHMWAELSEQISTIFDDLAIKYGGGPKGWQGRLNDSSEMIAAYEDYEKKFYESVTPRQMKIQYTKRNAARHNPLKESLSKKREVADHLNNLKDLLKRENKR